MSVLRFKGVTADLASWEATTRIIPEEVWALVVFPDNSVGLKSGQGVNFANTPWIHDPRDLGNKLDKQVGEGLSSVKFLAEDNNYYEVQSGLDLDQLLLELDERGLEIITKEEAAWIREQMYQPPVLSSFTVSGFNSKLEMGEVVTGTKILNWVLSNAANIATLTISVTQGTWTNNGVVPDPENTVSRSLEAQSPISFNTIQSITWRIQGVDSKGNTVVAQTKTSTWTHRLHWGTITGDTITTLAEIIGRQDVHSNSRLHTMSFTPTASQKSIILIPQDIDQSGINIVNSNAPTIDHSYGMNDGTGGTTVAFTVTDSGIVYNAYVSYNPSLGSSTAIIK